MYFCGDVFRHANKLTMDDSAKSEIDVSVSVSFLAKCMACRPQQFMFLQN